MAQGMKILRTLKIQMLVTPQFLLQRQWKTLYYLFVDFGELFQIIFKKGDFLLLSSTASSVI